LGTVVFWDVVVRRWVNGRPPTFEGTCCQRLQGSWTFLEDESDIFLRNVGDDLLSDIASNPRRPESSIVPLWKPQNSQSNSCSVNGKICVFLWNAKYPWRVHEKRPLDNILGQMSQAYKSRRKCCYIIAKYLIFTVVWSTCQYNIYGL